MGEMVVLTAEPIEMADFTVHQTSLINREAAAEEAETGSMLSQMTPTQLARAGVAITNLVVISQRTGLGGRTVVELGPDPTMMAKPSKRKTNRNEPTDKTDRHDGRRQASTITTYSIRPGDVVAVHPLLSDAAKKKEKSDVQTGGPTDAVVVSVTASAVFVALRQDDVELGTGRLWIVKLANEITFHRIRQLMSRLKTAADQSLSPSPLSRMLLGQMAVRVPSDTETLSARPIEWHNPALNDTQKHAVSFALAAPDIALIHGPPGTGKTHTLVELILQIWSNGKSNSKVLVCAPSNVAVDNVVERLAKYKIPIVRLGHPARLLPAVLDHSLDVLVRSSDSGAIVSDVRKEMDQKRASISKTKSGRDRHAIYSDLKDLRAEFRVRERKCVADLITSSAVVLTTLHGAGSRDLRSVRFDVVVVDEASQALEAQTWLATTMAPKLVLAGDHLQLPPTVKSSRAKGGDKPTTTASTASNLGLETSLFGRIIKGDGQKLKRMLTTQYRMHDTIMQFPSTSLYDSNLISSDSVKDRVLTDLPHSQPDIDFVDETEDTTEPLVFFDTQGGLFPECKPDDPSTSLALRNPRMVDSKWNENEAVLTVMHAKSLVLAGVSESDIAVISPYNGQVSYISRLLKPFHPSIEVGSIDGFQGREKEAVIVSLVRSNDEFQVGFLAEKRRLNVAMTRPKRHLCVIGDSETVSRGSSFLKSWMEYLTENADLRFPDPSDLEGPNAPVHTP